MFNTRLHTQAGGRNLTNSAMMSSTCSKVQEDCRINLSRILCCPLVNALPEERMECQGFFTLKADPDTGRIGIRP